MFLCKDVSQRYLLSVYWERGELLIVIKEMLPNQDLVEFAAIAYAVPDAKLLMELLSTGPTELGGVDVDRLTAIAIAGRVAEGLRTTQKKARPISRIRPEHWG